MTSMHINDNDKYEIAISLIDSQELFNLKDPHKSNNKQLIRSAQLEKLNSLDDITNQ